MLILQSFRSVDVPEYISRCLATVRSWAARNSYQYLFTDDALFDVVPSRFRLKAAAHLELVTDIARLLEVRRLLTAGCTRVVWIDADVLIVDEVSFAVPTANMYAYCRETWCDFNGDGVLVTDRRVNNAVCTFTQGSLDHLNEYIEQCYKIVGGSEPIRSGLEIGTRLLSVQQRQAAHVKTVGIASPVVIYALLYDKHALLRRYVEAHGYPVFAMNMCNAFRRRFAPFVDTFDSIYEYVIGTKLLNQMSGVPQALSRK